MFGFGAVSFANREMFSQFFVLNLRGDTVIFKDYRGHIYQDEQTSEILYRYVSATKGDCPPIVNIEGIHFIFTRYEGLFFVLVSRSNVSANLGLEYQRQIVHLLKDYLAELTEEAIRKNFSLIYELLEETMDFGYPQLTTTEILKPFVHNEAPAQNETGSTLGSIYSTLTTKSVFDTLSLASQMITSKASAPVSAAKKSVITNAADMSRQNEIFVDVIEKVTVLLQSNGSVTKSEASGVIMLKSFLHGNPEIRLALSEGLSIGRQHRGAVHIDDVSFHECVRRDRFDAEKALELLPIDGEMPLINYRTSAVKPPLRISLFLEEATAQPTGLHRLDVIIQVRADIPAEKYAHNVIVRLPLPKDIVTSVSCETALGSTTEYNKEEGVVIWNVGKLVGSTEVLLRVKVSTGESLRLLKNRMSLATVDFEIPMWTCSGLQIRYLKILDHKNYSTEPLRWIRYLTLSGSYAVRTTSNT
eukprot:TRINITY_DN669_c0_g1_i1.p1 TRINITY_DN669_c0_g1~~TRINITY_DN669_c0_g1_i1.p1  ORF type:complete len:473 (-),score=52.52 TRINITY_DN669_c0_g1_i1:646-2064(-)